MENETRERRDHVTFDKDGFTIRIYSAMPVEDWSDTVRALLRVLSAQNPELASAHETLYCVYNLLEALLPEWETIRKMNV
ncbi:hypothetical protein EV202_1426 [Bacteroides heparinolyticus]|uniref:Uncharacterized protein n=1 Tax=Prevotella heparinolytica TaxID=28113 RepID=A0A4R2LG80_9BACE|nr:hypothetical protein [Bacteroides heparinolyticus]TCO86681.1 hypothetical protein EV202_1426 [Bacteroides heparinolyticus]